MSDKTWVFKFPYYNDGQLTVKCAFVSTYKNTDSKYDMTESNESRIVLSVRHASLIAMVTMNKITKLCCMMSPPAIMLTPLCGAIFSRLDIGEMSEVLQMGIPELVQMLNSSCQSGGYYLHESELAVAAVASIVATQKLGSKGKNDERMQIITKVIKQYLNKRKDYDQIMFTRLAKYATGGIPANLESSKLIKLFESSKETSGVGLMRAGRLAADTGMSVTSDDMIPSVEFIKEREFKKKFDISTKEELKQAKIQLFKDKLDRDNADRKNEEKQERKKNRSKYILESGLKERIKYMGKLLLDKEEMSDYSPLETKNMTELLARYKDLNELSDFCHSDKYQDMAYIDAIKSYTDDESLQAEILANCKDVFNRYRFEDEDFRLAVKIMVDEMCNGSRMDYDKDYIRSLKSKYGKSAMTKLSRSEARKLAEKKARAKASKKQESEDDETDKVIPHDKLLSSASGGVKEDDRHTDPHTESEKSRSPSPDKKTLIQEAMKNINKGKAEMQKERLAIEQRLNKINEKEKKSTLSKSDIDEREKQSGALKAVPNS